MLSKISKLFLWSIVLCSPVWCAVDSSYQPLKEKLEQFVNEVLDLEKNDTELCKIMTKQGSDKGGGGHNYTQLYHFLFKGLKDAPLKIFEVGLGTNYTDVPSSMGVNGVPGASLRGWKEYFPNSEVYGADVDKRILFNNEERIKTFYVDQLSPETTQEMWKEVGDIQFDIMVDDGLHDSKANLTFLDNSFHKLKVGGYYIIEDIQGDHYKKISDHLKKKYPNSALVKLPHPTNNVDNCVTVIVKTS